MALAFSKSSVVSCAVQCRSDASVPSSALSSWIFFLKFWRDLAFLEHVIKQKFKKHRNFMSEKRNVLWELLRRKYTVWFQCKTSECLDSFKFLSMSCMGSFQWPFHYKKLLLSNKNICWATYLCSCDLFVSFSRAVNYIFFTYLFFIAQ